MRRKQQLHLISAWLFILTTFKQHGTLLRVERIFMQLHRTRQRRWYSTANKQLIMFCATCISQTKEMVWPTYMTAYTRMSHISFFEFTAVLRKRFLGITQLTYTFADSTANFISYYHRLCSDVTIMKSRRPKATSSTCSSLCSKTTASMLNATEINDYSKTTNVMIS